jgi:hypothetical protein
VPPELSVPVGSAPIGSKRPAPGAELLHVQMQVEAMRLRPDPRSVGTQLRPTAYLATLSRASIVRTGDGRVAPPRVGERRTIVRHDQRRM